MKSLATSLIIVIGLATQAHAYTDFTSQQQEVVLKAITESCDYMRNLTQVSQSQKTVIVDQGVRDHYFTTVLTGERRLDQNYFDTYTITVKSSLIDGYDHQAKTWGMFSVQEVSCVQE